MYKGWREAKLCPPVPCTLGCSRNAHPPSLLAHTCLLRTKLQHNPPSNLIENDGIPSGCSDAVREAVMQGSGCLRRRNLRRWLCVRVLFHRTPLLASPWLLDPLGAAPILRHAAAPPSFGWSPVQRHGRPWLIDGTGALGEPSSLSMASRCFGQSATLPIVFEWPLFAMCGWNFQESGPGRLTCGITVVASGAVQTLVWNGVEECR